MMNIQRRFKRLGLIKENNEQPFGGECCSVNQKTLEE